MKPFFFVGLILTISALHAEDSTYPNAQSLGERKYQEGRTMQPEGMLPNANLARPTPGGATAHAPRGPSVTGTCRIQSELPALQQICPALKITLLDAKKKTVSNTITDDGQFNFSVISGSDYFLAIDSKKFTVKESALGPYRSGDRIVLELTPKK